MSLLEVTHLTFTYPKETKKALEDVSFFVQEGEFVVVAGASGCGKTTLFRLLKRELAPAGRREGEILFDGVSQEELSSGEAAAQIGFVWQNPDNQIVTDKVWHELAFGLENLGVPTEQIRRRVAEMANYFGIQSWFHQSTDALSGGQKQLLNLAAVLLMQPRLLILDEPTSQLDPIAAAEFIDTLHKLNQELGLTILLCEHRLEEVFPMADRVFLMDQGKLVAQGAPGQIAGALCGLANEEAFVQAMPAAVRIFRDWCRGSDCPLTVREGKRYLQEHFLPERKTLKAAPERKKRENDTSSSPAISMKQVCFRYGRELEDILSGVDLEIHRGEIVSILGGNGSGKTTLLLAAAGLLKPYRGSIRIDGRSIHDYKKGSLYRHKLALLPQNPQTLFLQSTVREDFMEIAAMYNEKKEEFAERMERTARLLGIEELLERHPYDLSGGEQQKAALAKILLLEPEIILLDEPTKGVDAACRCELQELFLTLRQQGKTLLFVTHDIEFAAEISDRCALFFDGGITSMDVVHRFFSGNSFYTTAASRISRGFFTDAVTCREVQWLCEQNGRKQ